MATPDRTLLTEADVTNPSSKLGETVNGVRNRLSVVEVATGTQYGNVPTLTNVTEIPTDVSGRIDLVYTQPTTVHFDAPGLTDIVLSIEGYEHITWEGAVVHGTPDVMGVVWASAMWRDADATWHLLCEQDASAAGGGNVRLHTFSGSLTAIRDKSPQTLDSRGFVVQEAYAPFPVTLNYSDVVVDLENPAGGAPLTMYVNVPLKGGSIPPAFSLSNTEAVFRTPDNASYVKFALTDFAIRGDIYTLAYTVKIKGSPLRASTAENFDHPLAESLKAPGVGVFVVSTPVTVPGAGAATLTIARTSTAANSYIRLQFASAPAVSFPTEVVVNGKVEGHVGGSGRQFSTS